MCHAAVLLLCEGKTSLLTRFVDGDYQPQYKATLGADMKEKEVTINDQPVVLQIWDTAGQERFNALTSMFLKGANMCLLTFDLTRADSFETLAMWRDQFINQTKADAATFPFAVLANKSDMRAQRAVSQRRASQWCLTNGPNYKYYETSAKDSTNVQQAFMDVARLAVKQIEAERKAVLSFTADAPSDAAANSSSAPSNNSRRNSRALSLVNNQLPDQPKKLASCCNV